MAGTRVSLDIVVAAFHAGATAEEIARDYPSLRLADIYAVITYYLRHEVEVEATCKGGKRSPMRFAVKTRPVGRTTTSAVDCWLASSSKRI